MRNIKGFIDPESLETVFFKLTRITIYAEIITVVLKKMQNVVI
ncbi:hypothetical protein [Bacillus sp. FJAT-27225]|nr:hypothetical protein [Bacillus sp. FJAT-27225]